MSNHTQSSTSMQLDPPATEAEMLAATTGGQLGMTLFVAGIRTFVAESATRADIEKAAETLRLFALVRDEADQGGS